MTTVGVDVGYGHTKIVRACGREIIRSIAGPMDGRMTATGLKSTVDVVELAGEKWLVGDCALIHSPRPGVIRDRDWLDSQVWRALMTRALRGMNREGGAVIVTGLPVTFYQRDRVKMTAAVRAAWGGSDGSLIVKIIPQPLGSVFAAMLDDKGRVARPEIAKARIGVLDVGHYTTDLFTVAGLEPVERQMETLPGGVASAHDHIARDIEDSTGWRPDAAQVDQAARTGAIRVAGQSMDISQIAARRFAELAAEIEAQVRTVWKSGADLDLVILTGGGAAALKGYLKLYRHAVAVANAEFSNAEGFYKLGVKYAKR
ncbi:MAG: ParM/StbA family protein [Nitrospinae bacterium]|nr:ParM/StbA family protein [Nitrospinota bacterium]